VSAKIPDPRAGKRQIAGHFDFKVVQQFRMLAVEQDLTVQALLARALNDLFEKHGKGRPADESQAARGPKR
jgi:hypothetical protein